MARKLPWLSEGTQSNKEPRPSPARSAKRQRLDFPLANSKSPDVFHQAGFLTRQPSSSPPPLPPPPSSPLRPGLQADDVYIMVEDEFLATAQIFTKHLHHATYQDIKRKARERKVQQESLIARPTDGVTRMRSELQRRKRADALQNRTRGGAEKILANAARNRTRDSDESSSDFDADKLDPPDDGWRGTQLHNFIITSPQDNMKSLTGLQRIKSHTRAAAGFAKVGFGVTANKKPMDLIESDGTDDTDDLDGPVVRKVSTPRTTLTSPTKRKEKLSTSVATSRAVIVRKAQTRQSSATQDSTVRKSSDEEEDSPPRRKAQSRDNVAASRSDAASSLKARLQARRDMEATKNVAQSKPRTEEIPLFI